MHFSLSIKQFPGILRSPDMYKTTFILTITLLAFGFLLISCSKDDNNLDPNTTSFKGDFVSAVHTTSGVASINEARTTLSLTNFKTDSGPDLNIYLASGINSVTADFIDLGDIKGVNGNYTYDLPDNVNYANYKYVVVWCVAFTVNFGYAELTPQ